MRACTILTKVSIPPVVFLAEVVFSHVRLQNIKPFFTLCTTYYFTNARNKVQAVLLSRKFGFKAGSGCGVLEIISTEDAEKLRK